MAERSSLRCSERDGYWFAGLGVMIPLDEVSKEGVGEGEISCWWRRSGDGDGDGDWDGGFDFYCERERGVEIDSRFV